MRTRVRGFGEEERIQVSFDELYDEVLRSEFNPRGKHAAKDTGPVLQEETRLPGRHVAAVDTPIHDEFDRSVPPAAVEEAPAEGEGPRGLARYRNAAMVGAGGLACAAVGALLGGLGGYFTVNPAAAHSLASSASRDQSLAAAVNRAHDAAFSVPGSAARGTASFGSASGSLTRGIAGLQWLTDGTGGLPGSSVQGTLADLPGGGTSGIGSGGSGAGIGTTPPVVGTDPGPGCTATQGDLGLNCMLDSLTTTLDTLANDPTGQLDGLAPTLTGILTDVTGTLADLSSLLPTSSLPLPSGGIPASGLPGPGTLSAGLPGSSTAGSSPLSGGGGLTSLLNGVTAAAAGATGGSTSPSLPSLPLSPSSVGSALPVTTSGGSTTSPTVTTTTDPATGVTTTVTEPLPLPLPSTPTLSVGGVSVGTSTSGSGSGATLTLP
jgi:hypothetical protein